MYSSLRRERERLYLFNAILCYGYCFLISSLLLTHILLYYPTWTSAQDSCEGSCLEGSTYYLCHRLLIHRPPSFLSFRSTDTLLCFSHSAPLTAQLSRHSQRRSISSPLITVNHQIDVLCHHFDIMPRKQFILDLEKASASDAFPHIHDIRQGDDNESICFSFSHPEDPQMAYEFQVAVSGMTTIHDNNFEK